MKKCIFIITLLLIITGCNSNETKMSEEVEDVKKFNNGTIICKLTSEEEKVTMNQTVTLKFKSNVLSNAKIEIDAILEESLQKYANELVKSLEEEFLKYDDYGVSVSVEETSKGAYVTYDMDKDSFSDFYDSNIDKSQIVDMFEELGYTCE